MKKLGTIVRCPSRMLLLVAITTAAVYASSLAPSHYGQALEALTQRDIAAAVTHFQTALRHTDEAPERAKLNLLLGLCLYWNGQIDDAISAYEAVIAYDTNMTVDLPEQKIFDVNAEAGLGYCYKAKGDWVAAIEWWEKRLEARPDADRVLANVVTARRRLGQMGQQSCQPMVVVANTYFTGDRRQVNGHMLVEGPHLARLLGLNLATKSDSRQVEISSQERELVLFPGKREATLNGKAVTLPVAPVMVNGKMLVPLRFVAESFGRKVVWEALPRIAWVR